MAGIQYVVNAIDGASTTFGKIARSADALNAQLADLSKQNATPSVELQDKIFQTKVTSAKASIAELSKRIADPAAELQDKAFKLGVADAAVKLDRLSKKIAKPGITLEGLHSAELGILRLDAMLDKLGTKDVTAHVNVDTDRGGLLSRLLPGGRGGGGKGGGLLGGLSGGGAAAGPQGLGTGLAGLGGAGPYAIGAAAVLAAALAPALIPAALGGGVGAGAAGGAFAVGSAANKQMQTLAKQLQTAKGPARKDVLSQMAALRKSSAPELAIFGAFQDLGHSALGTFTSALESKGPGFSAGPGGQAGAPSFLTGLTGILKQLGGFIKTIGPGLGAMFRASIPFLQTFVKALEQAAKILLPVFTQSLRQMQPFLPMISQGLLAIVQGLAGMIKAMGPGGMKAAAQIFVGLCKAMEGILIAVGYAANFLAETIMKTAHAIRVAWDWLTAKIEQRAADWRRTFDGVRHDIAHIWDMVWNNTIGRMERGQQDIFKLGDQIRHGLVAVFSAAVHAILSVADGFKHALFVIFDNITSLISSSWRQFWRSTVGDAVKAGFDKVTNLTDHFRHFMSGTFDDIRHAVAASWDWLWDHTLGRFIKFNHDATARGNAFRHDIAGIFDDIRHAVAHTWDLLWDYSIGRLISAYSRLMRATAGFRHDITSVFDGIRHGISHIWDVLWGGLAAATRTGVHVLGNVLGGLKNAFLSPVRWVVQHVLDPMVSIWDKIVGAVGQKNLQFHIPAFATGGKVTAGTGPTADDVLVRVSKGETIISAAHSRLLAPLFSAAGIPGYATGGQVGQRGPGETVNPRLGPIPGVGGVLHDILGLIGKGASWITSHAFGGLTGLLGDIPGAAGVAHLAAGMARSLIADAVKGIIHALTSFAGGGGGKFTGHYGAGVAQWRPDVLRVLAMLGEPASLASRVLFQMQTESGGNPNAINLTDINAQHGDPSRGLMQVIGSTFAAYAGPFRGRSIYDPMANIYAAVNYAIHRYGRSLMSGGMGIGSGHGYAAGGLITEPIIGVGRSGRRYTFGEAGPEMVTPAGRGAGRQGPLVHVENMNVREPEDISLVASKLSFKVTASGFG